jgi:hypothetical protein
MPAKGTVTVTLTQAQAEAVARWLLHEYQPADTLPIEQNLVQAKELGEILDKAARRKRTTPAINAAIPRPLAQWFACFMWAHGWCVFGERSIPCQQAPQLIRDTAKVFYEAVRRRQGRHRLELPETKSALARGAKEADERVLRRLRAGERDLEWERREIDAAGPEPED